jgi:hypothetical protein
MGKSSKGRVVQPKALIGKLVEVNLKFQRSVTDLPLNVIRGAQLYRKQLPLDYFVIQTNLQSRYEYFYSNLQVVALSLLFMFTELRRHDKLYVIFQVFRSSYTM